MGNNLEHKDLKEVLQGMNRSSREDEEPTAEEVNNDWKRLASFMVGKT